jgi:multidrug resistance efflux pump
VLVPGATALVLADLNQLTLTVYVPEPRLGEVHVGQSVEVTVDSWPGRIFPGEVTHIADRAEYTPRNVATQEGRMLTYYATEIRMRDTEGDLKPGMPADAVFG